MVYSTATKTRNDAIIKIFRHQRGGNDSGGFRVAATPPLFRAFSGDGKRLGEIGDKVVGVLDADRQPYCRLKNSDPFPNVFGHTRVGHGGGIEVH
jgi:hypothetical protein